MLSGHIWTIAPYLFRAVSPPEATPARHFSTPVDLRDGKLIRLSGRLDRVSPQPSQETRLPQRTLVVFLHGMGGSANSPYMIRGAQAARQLGIDSLRLNMRGADRRGDDFYHGGLSADVGTLFQHPTFEAYESIYLLGFSLGGHIALASAAREHLPKLKAVAAVCAPIVLEPAARALDQRVRTLYRQKLLSDLKQVYGEVAARQPVPLAPEEAARIDSIVEWDNRIIAPRWGFESATHYYRSVSVGPDLGKLSVPTLVIQTKKDPMVLARTTKPLLERAPAVTAKWVERGGHIAFPRNLDLGLPGPKGLELQALQWMLDADGGTSSSPRALDESDDHASASPSQEPPAPSPGGQPKRPSARNGDGHSPRNGDGHSARNGDSARKAKPQQAGVAPSTSQEVHRRP